MDKPESGQNLIEFALIAPLIILFIAGIVVIGIAMFTRSSLQQAVREGARQAAVGATKSEVQELAAGNAPDRIDAENVDWCHPTGTSGTRGKVGDPVVVYLIEDDGTVGYPLTLIPSTGILSAFGAGNLTIQLEPDATARLEQTFNGTLEDCPSGVGP